MRSTNALYLWILRSIPSESVPCPGPLISVETGQTSGPTLAFDRFLSPELDWDRFGLRGLLSISCSTSLAKTNDEAGDACTS